ncbi:curli-like amyloid fiber formation chaperone CsgH [Nitrosomonas marina]|uniref:Curli assembly protein CsgC n=1 Tax=Nitrosomonas marina TaxID=917 RepID=A0A1H8CLP6_9PROT|nr:curli-like amyloid fiber formation chaperone CsgH [Nitrosomonas marina]SEM96201.1 Thin aggregative fimbriae synthesis protein [Nitrosomonas marina]
MKNFLTLLMIPILTGVIPHAESAEIKLWIEKDVALDNQVTITPYAKALRTCNLRYTLEVDKQGKSGRSSTRQSGKLLLQPNQPKAISTSSFNLKANDHYQIRFKLFDKNKLVAELVSETPDNLP